MAAEPQRTARILSAPALRGILEIGPYQVLEDLGPAPFGTVYLAADSRGDRLVCLKAIPPARPGSWQEDASWEILLAETEALGRIYHRAIPRVLEIAEHQGCLVVAFELAEGTSLREVLSRRERLDRATLIAWGRELLGALAKAHEQGILHRHLTEDSVLIRPEGEVVLTGFGLTELACGGAAVLPPEQMAGDLYTAQSDLYAAGSLLRRLAFASSLKRDPLLKVLVRATSANPAARYESAAEMADALREAGRAGGSPAQRQRRPQESGPEPRPGTSLRLITAPSRFAPPLSRPGRDEEGEIWRTLVLLVASLLLFTLVLATGWLLVGPPENKNPGGSLPRVDLPPTPTLESQDDINSLSPQTPRSGLQKIPG